MCRGFEPVKPRESVSHMSVAASSQSVNSPQKPRRFTWESLPDDGEKTAFILPRNTHLLRTVLRCDTLLCSM